MARRSVFDMRFQDIYSALIQKAERKGRTIEEVELPIISVRLLLPERYVVFR